MKLWVCGPPRGEEPDMIADYHVHCVFSDDSLYIPEKVVEDAWKNNLEIGRAHV